MVVTAYFSLTLARNVVGVEVLDPLIQYAGLSGGELWTSLYVVAVVGASLFSGYRTIVAFKVLNLVGLSVVALVYTEAFASVWCVYAGLTSLLILVHMIRLRELLDEAALAVPV